VQELGGSTARQPAQAGQWKYSIPQTACSVYEQGLAVGQEAIGSSRFSGFQSSLVWEFELFREFGLFWEFCGICKIREFGIPRLLLGD